MHPLGRGALVAMALVGSLALSISNAAADTVVLKDGKRLEGKVKVQELGKYVVIELAGGVQKTVMWEDLKEIEVATPSASSSATTPPPTAPTPPPAAPSTPPPAPKHKKKGDKTSMTGELNAGGVSGSMVHECGDGDPACREELDVQVKGGDVKAEYNSVEDCADEKNEVCVKKTHGTASKDGLRLGYSKETANRVTSPRTGATAFGLSADFLYGTADNFSMKGITAGLNARILTGGLFPDEKGGSWTGFFLEPSAKFNYSSITAGSGSDAIQSNSSALMLNGLAGIQWMSFGALDKKSLHQEGYGFAIGGSLGTLIPLSEGKATTTYGAALSYVSPTYNPGTGSFTSEQVNVFILPTSKMFLLLVGYQKSWG